MTDQKPASASGRESQDPAAQGRNHRLRAIEVARRALLARPRFSFRLQIYLGFLLAFIFAFGIATALVTAIYKMEDKLQFLDITNDYVMEIQQARRYEKNFFLYHTNLPDALENVYQAKTILQQAAEPLKKIMGQNSYDIILPQMARYEALLMNLAELDRRGDTAPGDARHKAIELELRKHGQKMVSFAQDLMQREKASLAKAFQITRRIHMYSLFFLLLFMVYVAYLMGSRVLGTINRFAGYAQRIAAGDFTPIMPVRRYRDEFTDLALVINQMIAELESREAVLVQSHKMRAVGTLTAGVAHELNNPLNNLALTAHMLLEDYQGMDDQERQEMIRDMVGETGRAQKIIRNLLDFARESSAQIEPLDLPNLINETIHLASNQIKLSGIRIEFSSTDNLPRVHGDRQQLQQVFLNLILNAMDASPKGGKIQVLVLPADEPNYLAVKVIDHGTGIPEHILGSIFDPFFTTKPQGKGTGLGLSVSQGIVGKHGGLIRVTSREGQGSSFTVTLPVTTIPAAIGNSTAGAR